jgi:nucleotide-binding universal stress UspA family protein
MFKTIVWATDGSPASERALPYARTLAAEGALVVVHCKEILGGRAAGYPVLADEDEVQAKVLAQVDDLRSEGVDVSIRIASSMSGGAAHAIADVAAEVGADAIVVGTRGHSAIAGLLLGSVTQRLLHIAPCPVFAVPATVPARVTNGVTA